MKVSVWQEEKDLLILQWGNLHNYNNKNLKKKKKEYRK